MTKLNKILFSLTFGMAALHVTPAFADVTINFASPVTISGATATYGSGNLSFSAYGFNCSNGTCSAPLVAGTATNLTAKNAGAGETGLGLANDPTPNEFEVTPGSFIQLNLSGLQAYATSVTLAVSSVQTPDAYQFYVSNTKGVLGTKATFTNNSGSYVNADVNGVSPAATFTLASLGANTYVSLIETAASGSVLLGPTLTFTTTPEPGSLALIGSGLLFGAGLLRRRRQS